MTERGTERWYRTEDGPIRRRDLPAYLRERLHAEAHRRRARRYVEAEME